MQQRRTLPPDHNSASSTADAPRRARDSGATFIELLISVVLIGTVGVAVLTAMAAAIRGADVHQDVADAQSWLASAGDALIEVPPQGSDPYVPCTSGEATVRSAYQSVVDNLPISADITVQPIDFWDSTAASGNGDFTAGCNYAAGDRLQRIRLTTDIAGATRSVTVIKRPALDQTVDLGTPPTTLGGGNYFPEPTPGL